MSFVKCEECQVGRCRPLTATYMRKFGPHMVVFPHAPAHKCDMCANVSFDLSFLLVMQSMLENLSGSSQKGSRKQVAVTGYAQEWTPVTKGS